MNEIGWDLRPRYIPTKFHYDPRKITPGRALTKCDGRTDRQTDRQTWSVYRAAAANTFRAEQNY